jgi:hypothetical protein
MLLVTSNLPDKCPEAGHPTSRRIKNAKRIPPRLGLGATYRLYFREGLEINVIGISYRFSCRQHTYEASRRRVHRGDIEMNRVSADTTKLSFSIKGRYPSEPDERARANTAPDIVARKGDHGRPDRRIPGQCRQWPSQAAILKQDGERRRGRGM